MSLFQRSKNHTLILLALCVVFLTGVHLWMKFLSLEGHVNRLESKLVKSEASLMANILEVNHGLKAAAKNGLSSDRDRLEQMRRKKVISDVCKRYRRTQSEHSYVSINNMYSQKIGKFFLIEEKSKSVYCFNHKAASSTWMAFLAKVDNDQVFLAKVEKTGLYYKVADHLGPKSATAILDKTTSGDYFTFTVVRHPFDRILSAFRDRIVLNPCSGQATLYVPRIFAKLNLPNSDDLHDAEGCIKNLPTFQQFLIYLIRFPEEHNVHWLSYANNCSPCLIDYDAVIKLETVEEDQNYVLSKSGLDNFATLETIHSTKGGKTEKYRQDYFSLVRCSTVEKLYEVYKMDFDLFEYDVQPFFDLCSREGA